MAKCQTCWHPMNTIALHVEWCLRCGSLHFSGVNMVQTWPPDLVKRMREFSGSLDAEQTDLIEALRSFGVTECIGDDC